MKKGRPFPWGMCLRAKLSTTKVKKKNTTPPKFNGWNLKMMVWKMIFVFQGCILRFQGCTQVLARNPSLWSLLVNSKSKKCVSSSKMGWTSFLLQIFGMMSCTSTCRQHEKLLRSGVYSFPDEMDMEMEMGHQKIGGPWQPCLRHVYFFS